MDREVFERCGRHPGGTYEYVEHLMEFEKCKPAEAYRTSLPRELTMVATPLRRDA